ERQRTSGGGGIEGVASASFSLGRVRPSRRENRLFTTFEPGSLVNTSSISFGALTTPGRGIRKASEWRHEGAYRTEVPDWKRSPRTATALKRPGFLRGSLTWLTLFGCCLSCNSIHRIRQS